MKRIALLTAAILIFLVPAAFAAGGDDILGLWYNQEKDARIEVYKCAEKYCGKIEWMKFPNYPDDSKDGAPGTPKLDDRNPDEKLRGNPRLGLTIVRDMVFAGGEKWDSGTVYDPKSGKTYSAKMTLKDQETLDLRGYVGISLFGKTSTWTRKP
jgi:uncharacterized protein (DUF2147 family)